MPFLMKNKLPLANVLEKGEIMGQTHMQKRKASISSFPESGL